MPLPRNRFMEDREYSERAPVFISAGSKFAISAKEADELHVKAYEQDDMMEARFRFFHFPCTLTKYQNREVAPCAACFARWVMEANSYQPTAHHPNTAQVAQPQPMGNTAGAAAPRPTRPKPQKLYSIGWRLMAERCVWLAPLPTSPP